MTTPPDIGVAAAALLAAGTIAFNVKKGHPRRNTDNGTDEQLNRFHDAMASICTHSTEEVWALIITPTLKPKYDTIHPDPQDRPLCLWLSGNNMSSLRTADYLRRIWSTLQAVSQSSSPKEQLLILNQNVAHYCWNKFKDTVDNQLKDINLHLLKDAIQLLEENPGLRDGDSVSAVLKHLVSLPTDVDSGDPTTDQSKKVGKRMNEIRHQSHRILAAGTLEEVLCHGVGMERDDVNKIRRIIKKVTRLFRHVHELYRFAKHKDQEGVRQKYMAKALLVELVPYPGPGGIQTGKDLGIQVPGTEESWREVIDKLFPEINESGLDFLLRQLMQEKSKFPPATAALTVHAECQLIWWIQTLNGANVGALGDPSGYIGVSKLSCAACSAWIHAQNAIWNDRQFYTRGTHGKWYPKWGQPGWNTWSSGNDRPAPEAVNNDFVQRVVDAIEDYASDNGYEIGGSDNSGPDSSSDHDSDHESDHE